MTAGSGRASPSTTKRALTARARQGASSGSTAFAVRCGWKETRKRSPAGPEAQQLREPSGRRQPTSSSLEGKRHRLVDERLRLLDGRLGGRRRQLRLDVRRRRDVRAPVSAALVSEAASCGVDRVAGPRRDDPEPPRATTCARRGRGKARRAARPARRHRRAARARDRPRASAGSGRRACASGRGTTCGPPPRAPSPSPSRRAGAPRRVRRRRSAADGHAHRPVELRLAQLGAGQRPIPVVGVARADRGHGRAGQEASTAAAITPRRLTICKVPARPALHSVFVGLRDLPPWTS